MTIRGRPGVYEFFAGGGLARLGLVGFETLFANDFDPAKARAYRENFGGAALVEGDIWDLTPADLPGRADLAWASSPCQDLSLAGARGGLSAARSGAFWGFWRLIEGLAAEGRAPRAVAVENVAGLLTSRGGQDFAALCGAMQRQGYRFGAVEADAALWLPQSRPRLFVIAVRDPDAALCGSRPVAPFHSARVRSAHDRLPSQLRRDWLWWRLAPPPARNLDLAGVLEPDGAVSWASPERTEAVLGLLAPLHRARLDAVLASGERRAGAGYRRVRTEDGIKTQRLEIRFDGLAGCLRTPAGGSSRQFVVVCEGGRARLRLLTPREAARLMGLPEDYRLPARDGAALKLAGDGVAVPVVRALADQILTPLLGGGRRAAA